MKPGTRRPCVSVHLSEELERELNERAAAIGVPRTRLVRQAVIEYLEDPLRQVVEESSDIRRIETPITGAESEPA